MPTFRPALRDSVLVLEGEADQLHFVMTSSSTSKTFAVDDMTRRLIPLLDGSRTLPELESEVRDAASFAPGHLRDVLEVLDAEALLASDEGEANPGRVTEEAWAEKRAEREEEVHQRLAIELLRKGDLETHARRGESPPVPDCEPAGDEPESEGPHTDDCREFGEVDDMRKEPMRVR